MKNLILHTLHRAGVSSILRKRKKNTLTVLSLHRISDERNRFWNPIRPKTFEQLLIHVKKHYQVVSLDEAIAPRHSDTRPMLVLSFDDGYHDFYEYALPMLVKHGLCANHNIVNECANTNMTIWTERLNILMEHAAQHNIPVQLDSGKEKLSSAHFGNKWMPFYLQVFKRLLTMPRPEREMLIDQLQDQLQIQPQPRMMNWEQIAECAANGVQIGSHTYTHDSLGTVSDREVLHKEIVRSKQELEAKLEIKVHTLALPNGQTGPLADDIISRAGFTFVLHVNDRLNTLPLEQNREPVAVNRINLVDEPFPQMALRTEMFHQLVRRHG